MSAATAQLKSHMSNCKGASYGVVTNVSAISFYDKSFNEIDEIPTFDSNMRPSSLESFLFNDFINNNYTL